MKKETELTFTRTGEKWQRTGSKGTWWQEGSEGRREAGGRQAQGVTGGSRQSAKAHGWVVAWARLRRKGGMEGGK